MKALKKLQICLSAVAASVLMLDVAMAQSTPVVTTYHPAGNPSNILAPQVALCDPDDPCDAVSSLSFYVSYDTVFDVKNHVVHGLWFSLDSTAEVEITDHPSEKRVHVSMERESAVGGGGVFLKMPGIGIIDIVLPKRGFESSAEPEAEALEVFPNPCQGHCSFMLGHAAQAVMLLDVEGRVVWETFDVAAGRHEIPLTNVKPGVYLLRVVSEGKVVARRVVVGLG